MREAMLVIGLAYYLCAFVHRIDGHPFLQSLFYWWWPWIKAVKKSDLFTALKV